MRYTHPADGEWVQPFAVGYKLRCCDCGLVHRMDFRIVEGHVQFRAYRDARATAAIRRHVKRMDNDSALVGVIPQWRHREQAARARLVELHDAILRYVDAGRPLNPLWVAEYGDIVNEIDINFRVRAELRSEP